MPQRFVEVVDVAAEASSTLASLLASGRGAVEALNLSYGGDALRDALSFYNVKENKIPWLEPIAEALGGTTPRPAGTSKALLLAGVGIILIREFYIQLYVRAMLRRSGRTCSLGGGGGGAAPRPSPE